MRRPAWLLVLLAGCAPTVPVDDPPAVAEPQETLVVFALEPWPVGKNEKLEPGEVLFDQYVVSGSANVTDPNVRKAILDGMQQAMEDVPQDQWALCFSPRHGIRHVAKDGTVTEWLICFQCSKVAITRNGVRVTWDVGVEEARAGGSDRYRNITRTPQKLLNDTLEAAGVKLAE